MSERVESNTIPFNGKNYITVTTIEGDDGEPKKTEVYEKITEARYNEIAKKDGYDSLSISPTHGRRLLLLTSSGPIEKRGAGSKLTTYGTSNEFQFEIDKTGKTSLTANLNAASIESVKSKTGKPIQEIREYYPEYSNTESEKEALDFIGNISDILGKDNILIQGRRRKEYENLYYPETIATSKQDRIRFSMRYISGSRNIKFDLKEGRLGLGERTTQGINGSVTLPIPGGISDSNKVKFDKDSLDIVGALGFGAALNPAAAVESGAKLLDTALKADPEELRRVLGGELGSNMMSVLRIRLAEMAMGRNGMFSRIGGGILNPNMELLFQAPEMRTFNFSFTMSARSRTEATQIKKIIRFFKQGMSVKSDQNNIFIVSPNTFTIKYILGNTGNDHPSIGRIKECALINLNTSYGDGSTYMTFDDPDRTMTTYKIDMTFQELDPITEDDYLGDPNTSSGPLADADEAFLGDNGVPLDHIGY